MRVSSTVDDDGDDNSPFVRLPRWMLEEPGTGLALTALSCCGLAVTLGCRSLFSVYNTALATAGSKRESHITV